MSHGLLQQSLVKIASSSAQIMDTTPIAPYDKDHEDQNGPGDARPTALKVIRDQELDGKLQGQVFLVTGCTSGIGFETARALHKTGADVFITGRDTEKGHQVVERIMHDGKPGKVIFIEMHLDSLSSVQAAASKFLEMSNRLDCLICNAGKSSPMVVMTARLIQQKASHFIHKL